MADRGPARARAETGGGPANHPWGVEDGEVLVYRLFDVADAVDLHRAELAAAAPKSRLRLSGVQSATAVEFPRPPLDVRLGRRSLPLAGGAREVEANARVFDYGVVSICYRLRIDPGTPLEELIPLAEQLFVEPIPALDAGAPRGRGHRRGAGGGAGAPAFLGRAGELPGLLRAPLGGGSRGRGRPPGGGSDPRAGPG